MDLIGDDWLPSTNNEIREILLYTPGVICVKNAIGTEFWRVKSEKSAHIQEMVKRQRRRRISRSKPMSPEGVNSPKRRRLYELKTDESENDKQKRKCFGYQLMGDDFFLCMAKMDFGCSMKKGKYAWATHWATLFFYLSNSAE